MTKENEVLACKVSAAIRENRITKIEFSEDGSCVRCYFLQEIEGDELACLPMNDFIGILPGCVLTIRKSTSI